jgi:long-subunit acyl-CoA synthetase (AMP-forming)
VVDFHQIHYTSLYLGIIGSGGCFTGGNPGYTAHELAYHLRITEAKFILTSLKTLNIATTAAKECGIPQSKIFVLGFHGEPVPEGHQSWTKLLLCGEKDWVQVEDPDNTPAAFVSTSGTSGLPKAAIISHSYFRFQGEFQDRISSVRHKVIAPVQSRLGILLISRTRFPTSLLFHHFTSSQYLCNMRSHFGEDRRVISCPGSKSTVSSTP